MKRGFFTSASLAAAAILSGPAIAATNLDIPADVATALAGAGSAADVATIALSNPALAATVLCDARTLDLASPVDAIKAAVAAGTPIAGLIEMLNAVAECAPSDADIATAVVAGSIEPGRLRQFAPSIGAAAVDGVESAGLDQPSVARETAEIFAALAELVPGDLDPLADALARATDDPTDSGPGIIEDAGEIETADPGPGPGVPPGPPPFVDLPTEAQQNPSPS
ncbi:MAG: hypothetical protein RQ752_16935 [Thermohalobaculum sp.]|nr:hypothetical protein [Thermohalobaculum sp.]